MVSGDPPRCTNEVLRKKLELFFSSLKLWSHISQKPPKGTMEQLNETERNETFDIVWVHHSAIQLEVTKLKPLES